MLATIFAALILWLQNSIPMFTLRNELDLQFYVNHALIKLKINKIYSKKKSISQGK